MFWDVYIDGDYVGTVRGDNENEALNEAEWIYGYHEITRVVQQD